MSGQAWAHMVTTRMLLTLLNSFDVKSLLEGTFARQRTVSWLEKKPPDTIFWCSLTCSFTRCDSFHFVQKRLKWQFLICCLKYLYQKVVFKLTVATKRITAWTSMKNWARILSQKLCAFYFTVTLAFGKKIHVLAFLLNYRSHGFDFEMECLRREIMRIPRFLMR